MSARILVVDDEESIRKLLQARFAREGWAVSTAEDGAKALEQATQNPPDAVLTDIKMPELDGFQLIDALRARGVGCPVVMITGHGEKECAIEAMHRGAFDYLEKPFDMDTIALVVRRALEREELRRANERLLESLEAAKRKLESQLEVKTELLDRALPEAGGECMVGISQHIQHLKAMARTVAESFLGENDPVVLITGESGVGKEVVARYMHEIAFPLENGMGREKPFVAINCAAFPDNLLESELFGYEKGAFTGALTRKLGLFELASGGTLFLDEIGEMAMHMQAKLLRVLQERVIRRLGGTADIPVRPHIVAATNRDLAKAVANGAFREDLYYRLNTLPLAVAPLRSRPEDVKALADHFLKTISAQRGKHFTGFSAAAARALQSYRWPGNVRELRSVIERAVILEKGPALELSHLRQEHLHAATARGAVEAVMTAAGAAVAADTPAPIPLAPGAGSAPEAAGDGAGMVLTFPQMHQKSLSDLRKEMDDRLVRQVLMNTLTREKGNVSAVARALRLDRANLLRMLKRFTIEPELFRESKAS